MPTLEERVAALEAQMTAIENNKYQMSYSGPDMEALLDFLSARKIVAGTGAATVSSDTKNFEYRTNVDYADYASRPVALVKLGFVSETATSSWKEVKPSIMYQQNVYNDSGKIAFSFQTYEVPNPHTGGVFVFQYIIMEETE